MLWCSVYASQRDGSLTQEERNGEFETQEGRVGEGRKDGGKVRQMEVVATTTLYLIKCDTKKWAFSCNIFLILYQTPSLNENDLKERHRKQ